MASNHLFLFLITVFFFTIDAYEDDVCISESSIKPWINGEYKFVSWDYNFNGTIYYNSAAKLYLFPWIDSYDQRYYLIHNNISDGIGYSFCRVISSPNTMTPDNCYSNNGVQIKSYLNGEWMDDPTATLMKCDLSGCMLFHT